MLLIAKFIKKLKECKAANGSQYNQMLLACNDGTFVVNFWDAAYEKSQDLQPGNYVQCLVDTWLTYNKNVMYNYKVLDFKTIDYADVNPDALGVYCEIIGSIACKDVHTKAGRGNSVVALKSLKSISVKHKGKNISRKPKNAYLTVPQSSPLLEEAKGARIEILGVANPAVKDRLAFHNVIAAQRRII